MDNNRKNIGKFVDHSLKKYKESGDCELKCKREVLKTDDGVVVVCNGCNRIVMDMR